MLIGVFIFREFGMRSLKIGMVMFERGYVVDIVFYNIIGKIRTSNISFQI